jgi:quinol monooxygenase YgiN
MVRVSLFVRLRAKPGKEAELAKLLEGGLSVVQQETQTPLWFALRFNESTYAIFDAFETDAGRQAHLAGQLAAALMSKAPELLAEAPVIERADVLAVKAAA